MSFDWKAEWEKLGYSDDIYAQLGRSHFNHVMLINLLKDINQFLRLQKSDTLLDIGCSNGLISAFFSIFCNKVVGVDYSGSLIKKAKDHFGHIENLSFQNCDMREVSYNGFDKVLVNSVFQYIKKDKSILFLRNLAKAQCDKMFIGHVPYIAKKESFLRGYEDIIKDPKLLKERIDIWENRMTWYSKDDFINIFRDKFKVSFYTPHKSLVQYKYAIDVAIEKK